MKTRINNEQLDDIQDWLLDCILKDNFEEKGLVSMVITGYSKGYGKNLVRYANKRARSVYRGLLYTMKQFGYTKDVIDEFKKKTRFEEEALSTFQQHETNEDDRKVEFKLTWKWKTRPQPSGNGNWVFDFANN